jgi:hypothetical protein
MFPHPYITSRFSRERQRDLMAWAAQQRLARQCRTRARARRAAPATRRLARSPQPGHPAALAP